MVTSLANLGKTKDPAPNSNEVSMIESLSNGDTSYTSLCEFHQELQTNGDVSR